MLLKNTESVFHELIVIGLVTGGFFKLGNARSLGKGNPDFGDKYALHIKTNYVHNIISFN